MQTADRRHGRAIPLFGIFFVIGVPVMSIAARFVLRPLLKDLTEAVRGARAEEIAELAARLARLESGLAEQGDQVERLAEAEQFRRQLEGRPSGAAPPAPSGAHEVPGSRVTGAVE